MAAISIVAYNGVQDKAKLSTVHSDLANAKKKLMVFKAEEGVYPRNSVELTAAGLRVSGVGGYDIRPSYSNFYYCADTNGADFAIGARVSGSVTTSLFITSTDSIQPHTGLVSQGTTCAKIGLTGTGAADGAFSTSGLSTTGGVSAWLNG